MNEKAAWINEYDGELCNMILQNTRDIMLILNNDGKVIGVNKMAVKSYGYIYEELVNMYIWDIRNSKDIETIKKQFSKAKDEGVIFETMHFRKDGTSFPVEVNSVSICEGKIIISVVRDISDRLKKEDENRKLAAIVENSQDAIIGKTIDGIITSWNIGAEKIFGYSKDEVLGKNITILVHDDYKEDFEIITQKIKNAEEIIDLTTVRRHKNGNKVYVSLTNSFIKDNGGNIIGVSDIERDITEKHILHKKLNENEERWRIALESGELGVWEWNLKTNFIYYNEKWNDIMGFSNDISNYGYLFEKCYNYIHPDDLEFFKKSIERIFKEEIHAIEYRLKTEKGNYKWIRTKGKASEYSDDGKLLKLVGISEDITAYKKKEQELNEKYEEIAKINEDLINAQYELRNNYDEMEKLKDEADIANKSKSQFLANISHEIRTPMNGIIGACDLLNMTSLNEQQKEYCSIVKTSSGQLLSLINDLLDISKIESGKLEIFEEEFNLKQDIENVMNEFRILGHKKGIEVMYYIEPFVDENIIGDSLRLNQVLINLIGNAVKFTEKGHVILRVKKFSSGINKVKLEFSVEDTGIGIDEKQKDKLFKSFSQGDSSYTKKYGGTGLGLAISKQLISMMNGDIWVDNKNISGSVFYFTAEFKMDNNIKSKINDNEIAVTLDDFNKKNETTILVVEDNEINQKIITTYLKLKGYNFESVKNGKKALEILKNKEFSLVLMDIQMPELNGFETTKMIREDEVKSGKHMPIIAMTAYAMVGDKEKCISANMDDYISKPIKSDELYMKIEKYL